MALVAVVVSVLGGYALYANWGKERGRLREEMRRIQQSTLNVHPSRFDYKNADNPLNDSTYADPASLIHLLEYEDINNEDAWHMKGETVAGVLGQPFNELTPRYRSSSGIYSIYNKQALQF